MQYEVGRQKSLANTQKEGGFSVSRGLSIQQQEILTYLKKYRDWTFVGNLACINKEDFCIPTESEKQSCWRAVRSLQKRGLVECQNKKAGYMERIGNGRGGVSHNKMIRLSVQFKPELNCAKRLTEAS